MSDHQFLLTLSCPDRPGIVAAVTGALLTHGGNIQEAHQFNDTETFKFFARIRFNFVGEVRVDELRAVVSALADRFTMDWSIRDLSERQRVLIMVSRFDHCLADLLYRWHTGELAMELVGIVGNHPRESYAYQDFHGVPFHFLPVTAGTRPAQEAEIWRLIAEQKVDLVVLARYMQILSDELVSKLLGRCINIHHSFLPSFKGARPYHQAHARGVKLIGATAHYVSLDLDEGPIIEQCVESVSHYDTPEMLIRKGRDAERRALARAVAWHLDGRVLLNGQKTVVFKD
jgi:formyltetrahydrofolate deformylase